MNYERKQGLFHQSQLQLYLTTCRNQTLICSLLHLVLLQAPYLSERHCHASSYASQTPEVSRHRPEPLHVQSITKRYQVELPKTPTSACAPPPSARSKLSPPLTRLLQQSAISIPATPCLLQILKLQLQ